MRGIDDDDRAGDDGSDGVEVTIKGGEVGSNLYGTWLAFLASSPRADITLPSANRPQLMLNMVGYQSS